MWVWAESDLTDRDLASSPKTLLDLFFHFRGTPFFLSSLVFRILSGTPPVASGRPFEIGNATDFNMLSQPGERSYPP
jgi:hypothetical protein